MTSRREFLHAAALAAVPTFAGAEEHAAPAERTTPAALALHAFLIDARHAEARIARERLARSGTAVREITDGDITQVWLRHIRPVWQGGPAAFAGLTERSALFCLEQLGWAAGVRVAFHAEHCVHPDGHADHALLRGGATARLSARDLRRAGTGWPALIAASISSYSARSREARRGPSIAALAPDRPDGARLLTSWILAPV
jgi:hypothetical protein